jgi:20S proteasome alpha/beta subunit
MNIVVCLIYTIIGGTIFIGLTYKNGVLEAVLTKEYLNNIINKIKKVLHIK